MKNIPLILRIKNRRRCTRAHSVIRIRPQRRPYTMKSLAKCGPRSAGRVIHTLVLCTDIILAFEASGHSNDVKIRYFDSQSVGWLISYHPTLRCRFGTVSDKSTTELVFSVLSSSQKWNTSVKHNSVEWMAFYDATRFDFKGIIIRQFIQYI
jgi:hypothetical protein